MSSTDLPLTEKGVRQSEAAGECLRKILRNDAFHRIYASSLVRAVQTAAVICGDESGIVIRGDLKEMDLGRLEGLTWEERAARYPGINIESELSGANLPGGEGFLDVKQRCNNFIKEISAYTYDDNILIVSHGITIRVLINCLLNKADHCVDYINWGDNTAITEIEWSPYNNIRKLNRLNDVSHLSDLRIANENYNDWGFFASVDYSTV